MENGETMNQKEYDKAQSMGAYEMFRDSQPKAVEPDKGVWNWTRICFYSMIGFWVLADIFLVGSTENVIGIILSLITCAFVFATFVLSIIHLIKYPQKGLAITALVLSSIGLLLFVGGFIVGAMSMM